MICLVLVFFNSFLSFLLPVIKIKFFIVGKDAGYKERLKEIIEKKRLKNKIILDEKLLDSLKSLKDFYGIAVGFDRLFMLKKSLTDIKDAICFSIDEI